MVTQIASRHVAHARIVAQMLRHVGRVSVVGALELRLRLPRNPQARLIGPLGPSPSIDTNPHRPTAPGDKHQMHPSKLVRAVLIAGTLAAIGTAAGIAAAAAAPSSTTHPSAQSTTPQTTTPQSTTPQPATPQTNSPKSTTPKSTPPNGHHCPHMGSGSNGSAYTGPEGGPGYGQAGTTSQPGPPVTYQ